MKMYFIFISLYLISCAHSSDLHDSKIKHKYLLQSVAGEVSSGKYFHYSLNYNGPLSLYLESKSGDADLYVSTSIEKPTFEPETYDLQSSCCGIDVVHIPESYKRPVHISVYGHPSYELSLYSLDVVFREKSFDSEINADNYFEDNKNRSDSLYNQAFNKNSKYESKGKDIFFILNIVEPFLSFLEL